MASDVNRKVGPTGHDNNIAQSALSSIAHTLVIIKYRLGSEQDRNGNAKKTQAGVPYSPRREGPYTILVDRFH